jgi:hypothetical protein
MNSLKTTIRRMLPKNVALAYIRYRQEMLDRRNERLTTEEVFSDIYSKNLWGGQSGAFFSGDGSHQRGIVSPYISRVIAKLNEIGAASMTVVDLGCGDYSVSRLLAPACGQYIGIDIVKPLVIHNQATFGSRNVSFRHANIVEDVLPEGDICLVRQVLQHLSNDQIAVVLPKLNKFRQSFITEHHPSAGKLLRPNRDKPQGGSIRISQGSGVFVDEPPFNIPAARYSLLLEVPGVQPIDGTDGGVIRTYILKGDNSLDARQQPRW